MALCVVRVENDGRAEGSAILLEEGGQPSDSHLSEIFLGVG